MIEQHSPNGDPTGLFHPLVAGWFARRYAAPTRIQGLAWPRIAAGEHVLLSAPTGSGKTLTAFLFALNQLITGAWPVGRLSVLYISPLKALNSDIQVNLLDPIAGLKEHFREHDQSFPEIAVLTRSGDTPQSERQRMVRRPPEILITTPESLNIILSSARARGMLMTVRTVILDEIHAVIGNRRGTHLITAVERLAAETGEFQRIGISATVRPMDRVAAFMGGYRRDGADYDPRPVVCLAAPHDKRLELAVRFPGAPGAADGPREDSGPVWDALVAELKTVIERNRSTLVFVATRRHSEKITRLLNEDAEEPLAYAHHGSLSTEIRRFVEGALRSGRLRAIAATSSLELGIDVGALDQVVMVRTPLSVASSLQRIGRAGHQVGATSRGLLFPLHGRDAVDAAVMARCTLEQDIEEAAPVVAPLDVLAQLIVSMAAVAVWNLDELYATVRASWPYHLLERRLFDLVVEMLAGRYAETRIRELQPRVIVDRVDNTVRTREGALAVLFQSGGTIPDRGYFTLRVAGGGVVGELDEEFVWERRVGESFIFGSQLWTIARITERDVEVAPGARGSHVIPFWRAEALGRDVHYAGRVLDFLEACDLALEHEDMATLLNARPELDESTRGVIADYLARQRATTGTSLPHRHHIVAERCLAAPAGRNGTEEDQEQIVIHCPWGSRVTRPLALAISALWEEERGSPPAVFADNNSIIFRLPREAAIADLLGPAVCRRLLRPGHLEALLRRTVEQSGMFGALFRENAGRALLLPRGGFNRRMPLWLNRIRSRKLLSAVSSYEDFPILLETWRGCLQDEFDLETVRLVLSEVAAGVIRVSECETPAPSPFAMDTVWQQTNIFMYQDDSRPGEQPSRLNDSLLREAAVNAALRPHIPAALVTRLEERLQRLAPGYAPGTPQELVQWVKERIAIPEAEALSLRDAMAGTPAIEPGVLEERLCWVAPDDRPAVLCAVEQLGRLRMLIHFTPEDLLRVEPETWWVPPPRGPVEGSAAARPGAGVPSHAERFLSGSPEDLSPATVLGEWLRYYGPRAATWPRDAVGVRAELCARWLDELTEEGIVVAGSLVTGSPGVQVCDAENFEILLAMLRRSRRAIYAPVPANRLVPLWAGMHALGSDGDPEQLVRLMDTLFGYPAPAGLWETEIIPARLAEYYPVWLDGLFKESPLLWFGTGEQRISFCLEEDLRLFHQPGSSDTELTAALRSVGHADFWQLADTVGLSSDELTRRLWAAAWSGDVSNDSFETFRKGLLGRFRSPGGKPLAERSRWPGRRGAVPSRQAWKAARPLSGQWFVLDAEGEEPGSDPITGTEASRERARIVLGRYGIVFRELLERELPDLHWGPLFTALRLMELSGEVVAGSFITGINGIQFAYEHVLQKLAEAPDPDAVHWMGAADPVSPCGLGLPDAYHDLPGRIAGCQLVFRGTELVMVSRRGGGELEFRVPPGDPDIPRMLAPLRSTVGRRWNPRSRVTVRKINGEAAQESPYAGALLATGFRRDYQKLVLAASYR